MQLERVGNDGRGRRTDGGIESGNDHCLPPPTPLLCPLTPDLFIFPLLPMNAQATFSAQAASNKKTGPKESGSGSVNEDSVLKDIMAELKQEPVLLAKAPQKKTTGKTCAHGNSPVFSRMVRDFLVSEFSV